VSQLHIYTVRFSHQAIIIYTQYNKILFRVVISSNVKSPVCNCNKYKHCFFYGVISLIIYFNTFFVSALLWLLQDRPVSTTSKVVPEHGHYSNPNRTKSTTHNEPRTKRPM